jgi:hypothetical protein
MLVENAERWPERRPPPSISSVEGLRSVLGIAGEHLGDLVWWTLSEAAVSRATLETLWTGAGLSDALLPEPPTAEKALKTAVRTCQVGVPDKLIRLGKETEDELVFAIIDERRVGDGSLEHHQEARVLLQRALAQLVLDVPDHGLAVRIKDAFEELRSTHTADDVRRMLVRALKSLAAVSLREGGGVYWVPRTFGDDVRRLEKAVGNLGSSKLSIIPVHNTPAAASTLGEVAKGSLETELAALQEELRAFQAEPPDRTSTLERRLEAFAALKTRAQLYRDVLKVQVDDLEGQLDAMGQAVEQLLQAH